MSSIIYRNNKGALHYLNTIYEEAPPDVKDEIDKAAEIIQREIDRFQVSKTNLKDINYNPEEVLNKELLRITYLQLQMVSKLYNVNLDNLIKYIKSIRLKSLLEEREENDKYKRK